MAKYLFSNNAITYITTSISSGATSINLPSGKGALFQNPSGSDYQMATIYSPSNPSTIEIIKITARAGDVLTVSRGQESSAAAAWAAGSYIENRITKATMDILLQNQGAGSDSIAVGSSPIASGGGSLAFGYTTYATGNDSIALGSYATASNTDAISIGHSSVASTANSIALGHTALVSGLKGIMIGYDTTNPIDHTHKISYPSLISKTASKSGSESIYYAGQPSYIFSDEIDLKGTPTDDIIIWTIPTGSTFFPDEFGVVVTQANTVTVQPQVSFGVSGNTTSLLATVATTKSAVAGRDIFTPISKDGKTTSIRASLKVAATATTLKGRLYIKGVLIED